MPAALERAPVGVLRVARDGEITGINGRAEVVLDREREALLGGDIREAFPASAENTLGDLLDQEVIPEDRFEEYYPGIDRWLEVRTVVPPGEGEPITVFVRDITGDREAERRIKQLERRLDRTEAIDRLVATVLQDLITAEDRKEIARTVCDRLGGTDLYEFVWVGERDPAADRLKVVAADGDTPEILEAIEDHLAGGDPLPEQRVAATGEPAVLETIADADRVPRPIRLAAFSSGLQSAVAAPLIHQETVYGVVGVYTARERGVSEQERTSLETLGVIGGFAINALRQESLLFADTITEVGIEIADRSVPFVRAAAETDATLTLDGVIPRRRGRVMSYVTADTGAIAADQFEEHPGVTAARPIKGEAGRFEVELGETAPIGILTTRGATVRTAEYTDRHARIVAELPPETELTRLIDAVAAEFEDVQLVRKERRRRNPETVEGFRDTFEEALTEKQRTVLRTAYLADYFESPRGSTSEEVAEALDITGPTVLYHLRQAQSKLLEAFFSVEDTGSGTRSKDP